MRHTELHSALIIGLVVLAGCTGSFSGSDGKQTTNTTPAEATTHSTTPPSQISVVNNRSTEYLVTFRVVRGPLTTVNLTYTNGSKVTKTITHPESSWLLSGPHFDEKVTEIEPVDMTEVARWSAIVPQESAVTLPVPVERSNVTLLVVVRTSTEKSVIETAVMEWCDPPHSELSRFQLHLDEGRNTIGTSGKCIYPSTRLNSQEVRSVELEGR